MSYLSNGKFNVVTVVIQTQLLALHNKDIEIFAYIHKLMDETGIKTAFDTSSFGGEGLTYFEMYLESSTSCWYWLKL